jgi:hypothetical protein
MTWAGCYALDLYCENAKGHVPDGVHTWDEFPHQYTDEFGSACRAKARKAGWIIRMDGTCICPKCSGKSPTSRSAKAK